MGATRTLAGVLVLVAFGSALAVRPLLANPTVTAALDDGLFTWGTLLGLPVVLVALVLVGARLGSLLDDGGRESSPHWNAAPTEHAGHATGSTRASDRDDEHEPPSLDDRESEPAVAQPDHHETSFLRGRGGTRDRSFELETEPPDADLGAHLDHLRAELDDRSHASELETMADVVEQLDDGSLPDRCPHDDCETPWDERAILRDNSRHYEVLDDGETVLCLECERTVALADERDR